MAVRIYPEVRFVRLLSAISYVVQPLIYDFYVKRHYSIDKNVSPDKSALAQRWDGFGINLSAFLNANIDVIVLTLFSTLINVSIYSVYALVTTGLSSLIKSISAGFNPTLGKTYANGNRKDVIRVLSRFENTILYFSFCVYTSAAVLIVPFVQNYTKGIVDANYYQPVFAMILLLSSLIYCLREPYVNLAYIANRFHEISKYAYLEAGINLVVSIIAVNKFGLNGVAFGTLCSMTYRTVFQLIYMRKKITFQSNFRTLIKLSLFLLGSIAGFFVAKMFVSNEVGSSWIAWILNSARCVLIVFPINTAVLLIINTLEKGNEK